MGSFKERLLAELRAPSPFAAPAKPSPLRTSKAQTLMDEQAACWTEDQLVALAKRRGYKNPKFWAKRVLEGRRKKRF